MIIRKKRTRPDIERYKQNPIEEIGKLWGSNYYSQKDRENRAKNKVRHRERYYAKMKAASKERRQLIAELETTLNEEREVYQERIDQLSEQNAALIRILYAIDIDSR